MAEYNINFSTNASKATQEINRVHKELTAVIEVGKSIKLNLDSSSLSRSINITFRTLNKEIDNTQRRLSKLQIGSGAFRSGAAALGYREGQRERGELISQPLRLRGQAQSFEQGSNVRLQKELRALQIEASQIAPNTIEWVKFQQEIGKINLQLQKADKLADDIQLRENLGAFAPQSLAAMEAKLTILKNKAREITPNHREWQLVNKEIQKLEKGIAQVNKKPLSAGQRAGAAGGAFLYGGGMGGGVGSAVGGIAGGLMGGVPGAFAGAAIGQVVDNLGTSLAGITKQAAAVQQMQRGLALASIDAKDFAEAQSTVASMSQRLLIPLEQTTRLFTQLRVNTKQYNLSVADTAKIMEGTALAIMATGGSSEDLEGAMRAVVQIFSKGGVQAEELRGQLGERFPGAVVKFAQANKMSFEELQKGLENGEIGIKEFVEFAKKNYTDYAKFSEQLATAPEFAGRRLQIALEQISLEIGSLFGPMGADIQDVFTDMINSVAQFIKDNRAYMRQAIQDFTSIVGPIAKVFMELMKVIANFSVAVGRVFQGLFSSIRQSLGMANLGEAKARLDRATKPSAGAAEGRNRPGGGASREYSQALAAYQALGGDAAWAKASAPAQPSNLAFGGPGAGMSLDRQGKEEKDKKAKADSLESFERLRDQLANAYNQAEIERIKARYELEKNLQENLFDIQLAGANSIERKNIELIRALGQAEQNRLDKVRNAQLDMAQEAGRVAAGPSLIPSTRGSGASSLTAFSSQQLARATQEASRFTGIANMCSESVKAFYRSLGISLPGVTAWADTVRKAGQTMTDWSKLQAGDIVATGRPGDTPHVGVYTGGQNVFHQSRGRGLKAGNYPDLSYFQKQGYFVRPNAGAGMPGKVGSNESRDALAAAKTEIAKANVELVKYNALLVKGSEESKIFAQYIQGSFDLPELRLSNDMLKMRNDLLAQGMSEGQIAYREKLFQIDAQYNDLLRRYPDLAKISIDIDGKRVNALEYVRQKTQEATEAEKAKNDETLRGIYIQERQTISDQLAMARAITPDAELRTSIAQKGFVGEEAETLFQETKTLQGAQRLKEQMQSISSSIGDSFGNAFKGIITGSMTAQEALAGMFQSIADSFADMVAKMIAEWIKMMVLKGIEAIINPMSGLGNLGGGISSGLSSGFNAGAASAIPTDAAGWGTSFGTSLKFANGGIAPGGFTAFANGGMVTGPTMGLVGEGRYNEAIVPLPNGRSIPVELSGGNGSAAPTVIVNVDAKGTKTEGNEQNANQLGRVISAAVQSELIKQQRPGGLLASR